MEGGGEKTKLKFFKRRTLTWKGGNVRSLIGGLQIGGIPTIWKRRRNLLLSGRRDDLEGRVAFKGLTGKSASIRKEKG